MFPMLLSANYIGISTPRKMTIPETQKQPSIFRNFLPILLAITTPLLGAAQAENPPSNWKRFWIENSGCAVSMPIDNVSTESGYDVDSNRVYTSKATYTRDGVEYLFYVAVMQLRADAGEANEKLLEYTDYVKSTQMVVQAEGYKKINTLVRGKLAKGISDRWTDHAGNEYAVTGWSKGRTLSLMYVFGEKPYPSTSQLNSFFNSFQFPSGF